jgi:hypothetical protein
MRIWQIVVLGLFGLALAGCRNDPSIALLERDNFKKEQEIYRLRNRVEDLEDALNATPQGQPAMQRSLPPRELPPESGSGEGRAPDPARTRPAPARKSDSSFEAPLFGPLNVSPGIEVPKGEVPETLKTPGSGHPRKVAPPGEPAPGKSSQWTPPDAQQPTGMASPAESSPVAQITLHPALTGGIGTTGHAGDEGLLVVVEPRDFSGKIIFVPADISVALLDPALMGEQARLARWDFSADQAQGLIRAGSQPGIHLQLPWVATPAHDRLKVFVRYTTRDGRKLQAERLVAVAVNGTPPLRCEESPAVAPAEAAPAQTASRPKRPQWAPVR